MTLRTNARVAGVTFLVYIAAGMTGMSRQLPRAIDIELTLVQIFCALVLAVTLYAITRSVDQDVALLALTCRVGEGVVGAAAMAGQFSGFGVGATLFGAGSTLFCWLLLRGRLIPIVLAWLGLLASLLVLAYVPLQIAGALPSLFYIWLPMLGFEIIFGIWLIAKGADRRLS